MNRDDLLKRCVDRRVAHETSIVAVSHLFYVYLLSALKKGQRVEVPNFGTFGTHMVGVKRAKKMPFFEVDKELAEKVNERYRSLKPMLVGTYEMTSVAGEVEYTGKETAYDRVVDQIGKEIVVDTYREITPEEYKKTSVETETKVAPPAKEKRLMPSINLRDEENQGEPEPTQPTPPVPEEEPPPSPHLHETPASTGPSPLIQILLLLVLLAVITFALNYFGVIHLWGRKAPHVAEAPAPVQPTTKSEEQPSAPAPKVTPVPTPEPKTGVTPMPTPRKEGAPPSKATPTPWVKTTPAQPPVSGKGRPTEPPAGEGRYTIQVSSWTSGGWARKEVARLAKVGFDGFVQTAEVGGITRYRVRVGRYATPDAASADLQKLAGFSDGGPIVAKLDGK